MAVLNRINSFIAMFLAPVYPAISGYCRVPFVVERAGVLFQSEQCAASSD